MKLVDEQNDLAVRGFDLIQNRLQTFFKFAAELRACDKRTHIEREQSAILQIVGNVTADDALCKSLCNGGLTDTGFTDQTRIVLRLAGQNLNHTADLVITSDDRVELLLPCQLNEVLSVFEQDIVRSLGIVGRHALIAADDLQCRHDRVFLNTCSFENLRCRFVGMIQKRQQNMLDGYILILHLIGFFFSRRKNLFNLAGNVDLIRFHAAARNLGKAVNSGFQQCAQSIGLHTGFCQDGGNQLLRVFDECGQQVYLFHLLIAVLYGQALRVLHRLNAFLCEFLDVHIGGFSFPGCWGDFIYSTISCSDRYTRYIRSISPAAADGASK